MSLATVLLRRITAAAALAFLATAALAEEALEPGPQGEEQGPHRAQEWRIPVPDSDGSTTQLLDALLYRPAGEGRRPLVIISHGSPRRAADRANMTPDWAERAAAFFVAQGYAVLAPMRRGYGSSPGKADDGYGTCANPDYHGVGRRVGQQLVAVSAFMRRQSFVDANRIILAGQSAGGFASLAAASSNPEGAVAVINFAGGRGSRGPSDVCGDERLVAAMGRFGAGARLPSLWLYAENDLFFGPALARRMHAAYALGGARTTLHILSAYGNDGHGFIRRADSGEEWQPLVREFLASLGAGAPRAEPPAPTTPPADGKKAQDMLR